MFRQLDLVNFKNFREVSLKLGGLADVRVQRVG